MVDIVESNIGNDSDISPELLPSLITAGTFSLVKCTGRPYLASGPNDSSWVLIASARHNVARILLEFLWTKISVFCAVSMPFGLDMDHENIKELLLARGVCKDEQLGFEVRPCSYSENELRRPAVTVWEPAKISAGAIALAEFVGMKGGRLELDRSLIDYIQRTHSIAFENAAREIVSTGTFSKQGNTLQMVTGQALIASFDDDTGYVDIDAARLKAWCDGQGLQPYYVSFVKAH